MVMPHESFGALIRCEIPQFYGHVGSTRNKQLAPIIKGYVLYRVCMAFKGTFIVPSLKIPNFESSIFASADHYAENGVEENTVDRSPVTDQAVFFGGTRYPF